MNIVTTSIIFDENLSHNRAFKFCIVCWDEAISSRSLIASRWLFAHAAESFINSIFNEDKYLSSDIWSFFVTYSDISCSNFNSNLLTEIFSCSMKKSQNANVDSIIEYVILMIEYRNKYFETDALAKTWFFKNSSSNSVYNRISVTSEEVRTTWWDRYLS
jgi:hypothetical protein